MLKSLKLVTLFLMPALLLAGCSALSFLQPTATPTATPTSTPTFTPTFTPTHTPSPTATPEPTCDADQVLKKMKQSIEYDDFQVFHQLVDGRSILVLSMIDPDLALDIKTDDVLYTNVGTAAFDALIASQELKAVDACTTKLFDEINVIVTDSNNNGWLSAYITIDDLPAKVLTDQDSLLKLFNKLSVVYRRTTPPEKIAKAPKASCAWDESYEKILMHFPRDQENMAFFPVKDDSGTNVWAQWVTSKEYLEPSLLTSLMNISMELACLHPQVDQLFFFVVDEKGEMLAAGLWDGEAMKAQDLNQVLVNFK